MRRLLILLSSLISATSARANGEPPPYAGVFDRAFEAGWAVTVDDSLPGEAQRPVSLRFRVFEAGTLKITSGRITACDPFTSLESAPFTTEVPKGAFPVRLALVEGSLGNGRVAFARIDFAKAPVVTWKLALRPGQDLAMLPIGEMFGYAVDAGTGSFADEETAKAALETMKTGSAWSQSWIDAGQKNAATKGNPRFHTIVEIGPGNIILFESGWGDGLYASWFGYDAAGTLAALVTDFQVIDWAKAKL